jgi:hypothetical protein
VVKCAQQHTRTRAVYPELLRPHDGAGRGLTIVRRRRCVRA